MAKRMPGLEKVETIIPKSIHELGPKMENLYRRHFVLWHWPEIVGQAIAQNVHPQCIEFKKLFLYTPDSSWRNEIRMMQPQILQKVNNYAGEALVKELVLTARPMREPVAPALLEGQEKVHHLGHTLQKINLPEAELQQVEERCRQVEDEDLNRCLRRLLQSHAKLTHLKKQQDWHKCSDCNALCPPGHDRCSVCAGRHKEEIRSRIRKILTEIPWARHREVNEYVPCTPAMVNYQRAVMVQQLASKIRLEDVDTLEAKTLTMLYCCLPPEHITEDKVRRTLYRLRKDLQQPQEFQSAKRYDFIPWGKKAGQYKRGKGKKV